MAKYRFRCKFCGGGFVREDRFMKHKCKAMHRDEEIRTPLGQTAWSNYRLWMTVQRRNTPTLETFLNSKFYTTFIKFTKFALKVGIPNTELYIKHMARQEIHPTIWVNDKIYGDYLQYLDRGKDPLVQAQYTVDYLFKIAEALDCGVDEVFDKLQANDVINMLQRRQLSPWILLHSEKFKQFYNKASKEQQLIFMTIIKPKLWSEKQRENPDVVDKMKKIVHELNL